LVTACVIEGNLILLDVLPEEDLPEEDLPEEDLNEIDGKLII
jgi:hypothetical protein